MERYFIPVILILGIILAALLTRMMNWLTWGENRNRKQLVQARRRARLKEDPPATPDDNKHDGRTEQRP